MEPITVLLSATGIGFAAIVYEQIAESFDFEHLDTVRTFRKRYLKIGYPAIVVLVGVNLFVKLVHILI